MNFRKSPIISIRVSTAQNRNAVEGEDDLQQKKLESASSAADNIKRTDS